MGKLGLWSAVTAIALVCTACGDLPSAESTRERARVAVTAELQPRFPGRDVSAATECILDNATSLELTTMAGNASIGNQTGTRQTVAEILKRRRTVNCIAATLIGRLVL